MLSGEADTQPFSTVLSEAIQDRTDSAGGGVVARNSNSFIWLMAISLKTRSIPELLMLGLSLRLPLKRDQ